MLHGSCYIVRPKPALREALSAWKGDMVDLLLEVEAFTQAEPDRSSWSRADRALQIKAMFMVRLRSEYGGTEECRSVLGDGPIRIGDFDRYWELEVYWPEEVASVVSELRKRHEGHAHFSGTGSVVVDDWVAKTLGLSLVVGES